MNLWACERQTNPLAWFRSVAGILSMWKKKFFPRNAALCSRRRSFTKESFSLCCCRCRLTKRPEKLCTNRAAADAAAVSLLEPDKRMATAAAKVIRFALSRAKASDASQYFHGSQKQLAFVQKIVRTLFFVFIQQNCVNIDIILQSPNNFFRLFPLFKIFQAPR